MKRPSATSSFLSSARTFNWQTSRAANSPQVLQGQLSKHEQHGGDGWSGLSLKPAQEPTRKSVSSRAWEEFLSAKRTIDPSYPTKPEIQRATSPQRYGTAANLQARISSAPFLDTVGISTKSVQLNGKTVYPNATSADNVLKQGSYDSYRGRTATSGEASPVQRRMRASNDISRERNRSHIDTLPGPGYRASSVTTCVSPTRVKPDFESHITELPGTLKRAEEATSPSRAVHPVHRNTATSTEAEYYLGPSPTRSGPRNLLKPQQEFSSFQEAAQAHGRYHNYPAANRLLRESTKRESSQGRALKERPASVRDLFSSSLALV